MPANPGDEPRRGSRVPREWTALDTPLGFERCVRSTLRELYGYVALLSGGDRREAELLVTDVYRSLFRAVGAGHVRTVTLGALRSAGRRAWLDVHRDELAAVDEVSRAPASTIAELSRLERAVLVFRHVNAMSVDRTATELGRHPRDVAVLDAHAVRRLRGTDDASGAWLRAYLGPTVTPAAGLVDRIVGRLGEHAPPEPDRGVLAPTEPVETVSAEADPPGEHAVVPAAGDPAPPDQSADEERPTTELAMVERPTVEIPTVVPIAPSDADLAPDVVGPGTVVEAEGGGDDPVDGRRRPTWLLVIGGVLLLALVVALLWLALRGDADDTVASSPDAPGATIAPTVAPTLPNDTNDATDDATPTSVVPAGPVELGFDPICAERTGAEPADVTWSDAFGPLAAEASLVVALPESVDVAADPDRAPPRSSVILRGDGAVVTVRASAVHRAPQTMVSRIGLDGTVVWVRCFDGDVSVGSQPDIGVELAIRAPGEDPVWTSLSLADGIPGQPLDAVQTAVLESPPDPSPDGRDGTTLGFSYDVDLGRSVPAGLDDGRVVWTASDVVLPEAGSFRAVAVGDVVLAQSCVGAVPALDCAAGELRGYDLASGDQLWARPGAHDVAASGDGFALVGDGSGWALVDVASGADVSGQRWDPDTFAVDADADTDTDANVDAAGTSVVEQRGAAIVVARAGTISIWLPADAGTDGVAVTIP